MTANGTAETYSQIENLNATGTNPLIALEIEYGFPLPIPPYDQADPSVVPPLNYTSPLLHTVVLTNLVPGTQYFYQVSPTVTVLQLDFL